MIRQNFKIFLGFLSSWAIKKHQIKTIVISGWYGTEITREFTYAVLSTEYKIRRILSNPTSDLSIPLAILGYKDTRRGWGIWMILILRVIYQLIFGKKQKHYIVLNINFARDETVKYWASFIKPAYLIITGYKINYAFIDGLIEKTKENKGLILYNIKDKDLLKSVLNNYQKTSSVGINNNKTTLNILENPKSTTFSCLKDTINVKKGVLPGINNEIIGQCLLIGKIKKIDLTESLYAIIKYGLPVRLFSQIKNDLKA